MSMEALQDLLPDYARDIRLNLTSVLSQPDLTGSQTWGTALACALATRNERLIRSIAPLAEAALDPVAMQAAKGAAVIMGMNNIYYRFTHMVGDDEYPKMPARLRMNVIGSHGTDKLDFELWCLAVSAMHGCEACVRSHEKVCREKGASKAVVQSVVKIASVLHAAGLALSSEEALR
jgi:alkyl hydroperoxide reductase subunit D